MWTAFYNHTVAPNDANFFYCTDTGLLNGHIGAKSYHGGGVNVLLCDGTVRFFADNINLAIWQAIGTRGGNDTVQLD